MMDQIEAWGVWHSKALAAGVSAELASLGRMVVRDYWQHGRNLDEAQGDGPYLGADRHHEMMMALAVQKPDLAEAVFNAALAIGRPDEDEMQEAVAEIEDEYADSGLSCRSPAWYAHVYTLDGCKWDLYTMENHAARMEPPWISGDV